MQWLAEICVKHPTFAAVLSLVVVLVGSVCYTRLGIDQYPELDVPIVGVTTRLAGASPADVELEITEKIEAALNTIEGIDELRSTSSQGVSQVIVQFVMEKSTESATHDVQKKVNALVAELPTGTEPPSVVTFDPDATPVLTIALRASGVPIRDVTEYAERWVRRRLESVRGVGQVVVL